MSKNIAVNISYIVMVIFAIIYFVLANNFGSGANTEAGAIGPDGFPKILAGALIILSIVGIVKQFSKKKTEERIDFSGFLIVLLTIVLTIAYFITWIYLEYFYITTFIYLFLLMLLFNLKVKTPLKKIFYTNIPVIVGLLLIVYFLFDVFLSTRF